MKQISRPLSLLSLLAVFVVGVPVDPAVAAPRNISKCTTLTDPGAYVVTRNLAATGDCLILAADFITLDLGGFTIAGDGTGSAIKSNGPTRTGLTIMNGIVRNFARGIDFAFDGTAMIVERVQAIGNNDTGIGVNGQSIVRDCVATQNGLGVNAGSRMVIIGTNASFNTGTGIQVGNGSTVTGNTAGVNGNHGIVVSGGGSTVAGNATQANIGIGLSIVCPASIVGNTALGNTGGNIITSGVDCVRANNSPAP